ncbi:hypothetical protein KYC_20179 [Achromobacter arsenitoxydans SY8]|uniref:Uncharacterized protein n=2 Tax=Achromobacter TaxID=222 RepID=H0FB79_9BURK|nr:hypothetical protein KYC_20179 [Achromobacter arsenitoxydans SY8]
MPDGFISRDLTISLRSEKYMIINLKDLLTLYRVHPDEQLESVILRGAQYVRAQDLAKALRKSAYFLEWADVLRLLQVCKLQETDVERGAFLNLCRSIRDGEPLDAYSLQDVRY